ncbi:zinc finger domain-containing protein [Mycobacteroides abscessus]|jgi:hypothetical protein
MSGDEEDRLRESKAASAQYPWGCEACGAKAFDPCRTKSGRVTDTHSVRLKRRAHA